MSVFVAMRRVFALAGVAAATPLSLVLFEKEVVEDYGARCLDGSAAGYYIRQVPYSRDWVLYLQGGGGCQTAADCWKRAQTKQGSSKEWEGTFEENSNVLNADKWTNPFAGFNAVYLPYCSGDTHVGNQKEKNLILGGVYTNGHLIMEALLDHLHNTTSMAKGVNRVLLSGWSAGGIGALHNADWLAETITEKFGFKDATVKAAPQGGLFFPSETNTGICFYGEYNVLGEHCMRVDIMGSWWVNREQHAFVHGGCMDALQNSYMCWSAGILAQYVKTPIFWAQNRYDSYQLDTLLGCGDCASNVSGLSDSAKSFMTFYGQQTERTLRHLEATRGHSVFMPNCYEHIDDFCMSGGPRIDGDSLNTALSDWFFNGKHHAHYDTCGQLPCASKCDCYPEPAFPHSANHQVPSWAQWPQEVLSRVSADWVLTKP